MALGDALQNKLADNVFGFCRTLRRAGLAVDSRRIALAQQALGFVDIGRRDEVRAALEAVLVSRSEDRIVFYELFDAVFRNPDMARQLMAQLLPPNKAGSVPREGPVAKRPFAHRLKGRLFAAQNKTSSRLKLTWP